MAEQQEVLQSLADLREIRRAVERAGERSRGPHAGSLKTHLVIQILAVLFFGALTILDLTVKPSLTDFLIVTFSFEPLRILFIFIMFATLLALCCSVYYIVWRAARKANEPLAGFITRNFRYLSLASFTSDLFVKFSAVAVTILARRPDWVPALLIAFIGDYLIQGRGFILPVRTGLMWGAAYLLFSVYVLLWLQGDVWYACLALVLPAFASMIYIKRLMSRATLEAE